MANEKTCIIQNEVYEEYAFPEAVLIYLIYYFYFDNVVLLFAANPIRISTSIR